MYGGVSGKNACLRSRPYQRAIYRGYRPLCGRFAAVGHGFDEVIEDAGGQVVADAEAVRIAIDNRTATAVQTKDGRTFAAPYYIAATHMAETLRIVDKGAFNPCLHQALERHRQHLSIF